MFKTVQELNAKIAELKQKHREEIKPYEDMFEEVYAAQMAACETLEEQWEIYKSCPPKYMSRAYSFNSNERDFCIKDYLVYTNVFDLEVKRPYEYCLHHWLEYDDEYISHEAIVAFFEDEPIEIEERDNITNEWFVIKVPDHIIRQWKETLIRKKTANIYVPRSW